MHTHTHTTHLEGDLGLPTEELLGLGGVAKEELHLSRAVVLGIDRNNHLPISGVLTDLLLRLALPLDRDVKLLRGGGEFACVCCVFVCCLSVCRRARKRTWKAASTNSRTEWVSPVATTKSSGLRHT